LSPHDSEALATMWPDFLTAAAAATAAEAAAAARASLVAATSEATPDATRRTFRKLFTPRNGNKKISQSPH
jgi:hypothetical protein